MRWLKNLTFPLQILIISSLLLVCLAVYIPFAKYLNPSLVSFVSLPLKFCQDATFNAKQFLRFQDLSAENKLLEARAAQLSARVSQLQEAELENERLRRLLSLPQKESLETITAELIAEDSSNWRRTILVNKGSSSGIAKGMPVILDQGLVGRVIEVAAQICRVCLIVDAASLVPAKIVRSRQDGLVYGQPQAGRNLCQMKYIQDIELGDKVISSGLGRIYPEGLLIGEVIAIKEEQNQLYKIAQIQPTVDFSKLEEVSVIIKK